MHVAYFVAKDASYQQKHKLPKQRCPLQAPRNQQQCSGIFCKKTRVGWRKPASKHTNAELMPLKVKTSW